MKHAIFVFLFLAGINYLYAEGMAEVMQEAVDESRKSQGSFVTEMVEGTDLGQKLFMDVILKMDKNNETNYDIEYIVNNYVDYVAPYVYLQRYNSIYDWMDFIRDDSIITFHYAFGTFLKMLDTYLYKKEYLENEDIDDL